jgi:hypothetical protein
MATITFLTFSQDGATIRTEFGYHGDGDSAAYAPRSTSQGRRRIRKAAASYDILLTCNEKLRKDEIWRPDARHALKTCSVIGSDRQGQEWRRTIRGSDREGGEIFLVVTLDADRD